MPDDPFITEMDPVQRLWLQNNWIQDSNDEAELAKNTAYLLASFSHPEAVKRLLGANTHVSTDEEFEETIKMVENFGTKKTRRQRHLKLKE